VIFWHKNIGAKAAIKYWWNWLQVSLTNGMNKSDFSFLKVFSKLPSPIKSSPQYFFAVFIMSSILGPIHTWHFGTQYCNEKIKIHFSSNIFFLCELKIFFSVYYKRFWNVTIIFWRKHIFLSKYLLIAILCAKILRVIWALGFVTLAILTLNLTIWSILF